MRGVCVITYTFCLLILASNLFAIEQDSITRLKKNHEALALLLKKIENGADPCFNDVCQKNKSDLVSQIYTYSDSVPGVDQIFLKNRQAGIRSAHDLIRNKFAPLDSKDLFPRTSTEWSYYWKKRSSQETEIKSTWMSFLSEVYSLNDGLQIYLKAARSSEQTKQLIQEAWSRGAADISQMMITAALLIDEAGSLEATGDARAATETRKKAIELSEKREKLEQENFKGQLRPVLESLFRGVSFQGIVSFFNLTAEWLQHSSSTEIFNSRFVEVMSSRSEDIKALTHLCQNFTDLEYGIVGLHNFYSNTNPEIAAENETNIQEFLDQVESRGRILIELGASYFLMKSGGFIFSSALLGNFALPTAYNILTIQKGENFSDLIWKPTHRTQEIKRSLPTFEDQMERRNAELLKTRKLLKEKLSEIELEISNQTTGGKNETNE
ncbi:MAG: hypothetical protein JWQ35_1804 [Bacteriovoracaceae bacterium]|nr:hypothetical protein [Bacteriovoracaceae bacterium]